MQSLKLQKICGYIIYIKSVVATILATILFWSGIYYCTTLKRMNQDNPITEDFITRTTINCSGLISSIVGFSYVLISLILVFLAIFYMLHGRKMIYNNIFNKKLVVISLIIECICSYFFGEYLVSSIFMGFRWELIYVLTFIPMLVAQSFFTIYLLAKSIETYKKELNLQTEK